VIANATTHRRANAFAQALDTQAAESGAGEGQAAGSGSPGGRGVHAADRHADVTQDRMLVLANALGTMATPELDPEVKAVQRAQLMAVVEAAFTDGRLDPEKVHLPGQRDHRGKRAATALVPRHRPAGAHARLTRFRPKSRWGRRLAASGLAVGVAAGGFSGVAVASSDALPGDTLYGLKRSMEDLRLSMADNDTERGHVYLDLASTRLKEARRLMERSKAGPLDDDQIKDVRKALGSMREEAQQGHTLLTGAYRRHGSLKPIEVLAAFSDAQRAHWSQLSPLLPDQLSSERDGVASVLDAIEQEVTPLRPLLPPASNDDGDGGGAVSGEARVPVQRTPSRGGATPSGGASVSSTEDATSGPGASASPPPSSQDHDRLLGGGGLLPLPTPSPSSSPPAGGRSSSPPDKEVMLPPLLPGLLPGLGLDPAQDSGEG
jgi:Domain of unknown function (DUF5667)